MIENWDAARAEARLPALVSVLVDAVGQGASVGFLTGTDAARATAFWRGQLPGLAAGHSRLFVAGAGDQVLGHVLLFLAQQPNAGNTLKQQLYENLFRGK